MKRINHTTLTKSLCIVAIFCYAASAVRSFINSELDIARLNIMSAVWVVIYCIEAFGKKCIQRSGNAEI